MGGLVRRIFRKIRLEAFRALWRLRALPYRARPRSWGEAFLPGEATIDHLLETGKSFVRWGDGESAILCGAGISFQSSTPGLRRALRESVASANTAGVLVGIPLQFMEAPGTGVGYTPPADRGIRRAWRDTRHILSVLLEVGPYGDAFLFRPASGLDNARLVRLWAGRDVILVSHDPDHARQLAVASPGVRVFHVRCPAADAFGSVDAILAACEALLRDHDLDRRTVRHLVSAGPTAKPIVHRIAARGGVAYDVGNYVTWTLYGRRNAKGV